MTSERDPRYNDALELLRTLEPGEAPRVSLLQRRLQIGYNQAARILEQMEAAGVVSVPDCAGVRLYIEDRRQDAAATEPVPPAPDPSALPLLKMTGPLVRRLLNGRKHSTIRTERSQYPSGTYRLELKSSPVAIVEVTNCGPIRWSELDDAQKAKLADDEGGFSVPELEELLVNFRIFQSHPYRGFITDDEPRWLHHLRLVEDLRVRRDEG